MPSLGAVNVTWALWPSEAPPWFVTGLPLPSVSGWPLASSTSTMGTRVLMGWFGPAPGVVVVRVTWSPAWAVKAYTSRGKGLGVCRVAVRV